MNIIFDRFHSKSRSAVNEAVGLHSVKEVSTLKAPMNVSEVILHSSLVR